MTLRCSGPKLLRRGALIMMMVAAAAEHDDDDDDDDALKAPLFFLRGVVCHFQLSSAQHSAGLALSAARSGES